MLVWAIFQINVPYIYEYTTKVVKILGSSKYRLDLILQNAYTYTQSNVIYASICQFLSYTIEPIQIDFLVEIYAFQIRGNQK